MQDIEDTKPREPGPSECCGSGCSRCVWDVYFDALSEWESRRVSDKTVNALPTVGAAFARTEPGPGGCSSYVGSVVLKYVTCEGEEDDFGVVCPSDAASPMWREHLVAPLSTSTSVAGVSGGSQLSLVELQLVTQDGDGSALPTADPGDTVELFVPNDAATVAALCKHFRLPENRLCQLKSSPFVAAECFPPWIPQRRNVSVGDLLTYYVDVSSSAYVRKPFLSFLQKHIGEGHTAQRDALKQLAENHKMLQGELSTSFPSLLDILDAFGPYFGSASGLPLAKFLEVSAPLRARKFSVVDAGASLVTDRAEQQVTPHVQKILLCARRVVHQRHFDKGASPLLLGSTSAKQFEGHVSRALFDPQTTADSALSTISGSLAPFPRGSCCWLRRPTFGVSVIPKAFTSRPLLLFCGGSGIAPALSILLASSKMQNNGSRRLVPPRWLFFSTRTRNEAENILGATSPIASVVSGQCSRLNVTVSRQTDMDENSLPETDWWSTGPSSDEELAITKCRVHVSKGRVGGAMRHEAADIRQWFHESQAAVVACGPSGFLTTVRETLASILFPPTADDDASVSEQQLAVCEINGDVVFEDWNQRK